jgi:Arc/MetJ-type ribon-helix-helix transcriptional regulator
VDPVSAVRLPADVTAEVDAWGEARKLSRSEAIRRLVELGLTVKTESRTKSEGAKQQPDTKRRARELAGDTIDEITDAATGAGEQANRKSRLLKGPEEFQKIRRDRPNRK